MLWLALLLIAAGAGVWLWSEWRDQRHGGPFWRGALRSVAAHVVSTLLIGAGAGLLLALYL